MAAIDVKGLAATFRTQGARTALIALVSTLALGVLDQFTARIIPQATAAIDDFFDPPNFILRLSQPTQIVDEGIDLRESGAGPQDAAPAQYRVEGPRLIVVSAPPGSYILKLTRDVGGDRQVLVEAFLLKEKGQSVAVDTSDGNWVSSAALERAGERPPEPAEPAAPPSFLSGTRWTATADDYALIPALPGRSARSLLGIALAEVGTFEFGDAADRARVKEYWASVPGWSGPTENLPWGGTFVSWVVQRAGFAPPDGAAAYASWQGWGVEVAPADLAPGMIAVFERPGAGPQRTRLMAGVVLRLRDGCTEVVVGNAGDRVAVTCVTPGPVSVRRPPPAAASGGDATATAGE